MRFLFTLLVLLLAGCNAATVDINPFDKPDKPFIERVAATQNAAQQPEATADAKPSATPQQADQAAPTEQTTTANATAPEATPQDNTVAEPTIAEPAKAVLHQRLQNGLVRIPEFEVKLNAILAKLQQAWPAKPVPSYVFVLPSPEFNAYSMDKGIFVAYGLMQTLESDDEMAACLAHEYSHILLGHEAIGCASQIAGMAVSIYSKYNSIRYVSDRNQKNYLENAVAGLAAQAASQNALLPVFSREQEDDADQLGTDLMIRAGYSPMGMINLMQRMASWENQQEERRKAKEAAESAEREKTAKQAAKVDDVADMAVAQLISGLCKMGDEMAKQHYPATEREKEIKEYIRTFYRSVPRNELQTASYQEFLATPKVRKTLDGLTFMDSGMTALLAENTKDAEKYLSKAQCRALIDTVPYVRYLHEQVAYAKGKPNTKALEADCRKEDAILPQYSTLVAIHEGKDPRKALKVAEAAFKDLQKPAAMLPMLIRLNAEVGNSTQVLAYQVACTAQGDMHLEQACTESSQTPQRVSKKKK